MAKTMRAIERAALLSECGKHRPLLSRSWGSGARALIVGLNPSTADAMTDDTTVRKLYGFGDHIGFKSFDLINLWSYRATRPKDLKAAGYPILPQDDALLIDLLDSKPDFVICAWGANARGLQRPAHVLATIRKMGITPKAFKLSADGTPWHPLMLPYSGELVDMR